MLVSATEMLKKAKAGHYAVGQFNINNLEWTKSILLTAQELKSFDEITERAQKYYNDKFVSAFRFFETTKFDYDKTWYKLASVP